MNFSKITVFVDSFVNWVGEKISWLTFFMVCVTFLIVVFRYIFNVGWVWMQELVVYSHAAVFLLGASYAFLKDEHVRVDIFHKVMSQKRRAIVEIFGILFFLLPICAILFYHSFPYVVDSWSLFEGSKDGGGLEAVFLLKSLLLVFCLLLAVQAFSLLVKKMRGE